MQECLQCVDNNNDNKDASPLQNSKDDLIMNREQLNGPVASNIGVHHSSDVTVGNKYYYQGPVTINQVIVKDKSTEENCNDGNFDTTVNIESSETHKNPSILQRLLDKYKSRRRLFTISGSFLVMLATIIIILSVILLQTDSLPNEIITETPSTGNETSLKIVSRTEWHARAPVGQQISLNTPVPKVIIAHTAGNTCSTQSSCSFQVKNMQEYLMDDRGFDDIAYNFLVGGDGAIYEGRGWKRRGAHTRNYNDRSICIAFIGNFVEKIPPENQLKATQLLIEEGIRLGMLSSNFKLHGQLQLIVTKSPGDELYRIIITWPHWSKDISY